MNKEAIIQGKIQSTKVERCKLIQKGLAVPLRTVIKETLMHLYCKGVIPKSIAQNVYDILKLKEL
jgi:hypothetical protein